MIRCRYCGTKQPLDYELAKEVLSACADVAATYEAMALGSPMSSRWHEARDAALECRKKLKKLFDEKAKITTKG